MEYPPKGQINHKLSRIRPIDCASIAPGSTWSGTPEFEEILKRLANATSDDDQVRSRSVDSIEFEDEQRRLGLFPRGSGDSNFNDGKYAKSPQNGNSLPRLNRNNGGNLQQGKAHGRAPQQLLDRRGGSSKNKLKRRHNGQGDGTKLPSVYRQ